MRDGNKNPFDIIGYQLAWHGITLILSIDLALIVASDGLHTRSRRHPLEVPVGYRAPSQSRRSVAAATTVSMRLSPQYQDTRR
jgi:hypothetical protein